jgi:hypothetical protein
LVAGAGEIIPLLRAAGHLVHTPTLPGLGERAHQATPRVTLGTNIDDVVNGLFYEDWWATAHLGP